MLGFDMIGMKAEFVNAGTTMRGRIVSIEFSGKLKTMVFTLITESGEEFELTCPEIIKFIK